MSEKDFADTFVSFARGEIGKDEMNEAVKSLSEDVVKSYGKKPERVKPEGQDFMSWLEDSVKNDPIAREAYEDEMRRINAGEYFQSTHRLDFESTDRTKYDGYRGYRIGTCEGLWDSTKTAYLILAVQNSEPGNGHFTDVLEWFEMSCKRDNRDLIVQAVLNKKLRRHLVNKRGFIRKDSDVVKRFRDISL